MQFNNPASAKTMTTLRYKNINLILPSLLTPVLRLSRRSLLPAIALLAVAIASTAFAGSATWKTSPATGNWNTVTNWTAGGPPNGPSDTATFAVSNKTGVSLSADTEVNGIVFNAGASAFTITTSPGFFVLTISGAGISNNSGITENFVNLANPTQRGRIVFTNSASAGSSTLFTNNAGGNSFMSGGRTEFQVTATAGNGAFIQRASAASGEIGGRVLFTNSATAGNGTFTNEGSNSIAPNGGGAVTFADTSTAGNGVVTNNAGSGSGASGGVAQFFGTSTGGNGVFTNDGATVSGAFGGGMIFVETSTAGSATLIANGGSSGGGGGGIDFEDDSAGGTSRIKLFGNGFLELSSHHAPGLTVGSIEGDGDVLLGALNLAVGSNNLSTIFSGVIQDGGQNGGTGGSLSKIGNGKLTLNDASTYTGGTAIKKGMLLVKNTIGSATGTGVVQVNAGTLEGVGRIAGAVTVGTGVGTTSKANLLAGNSNTSPGTLTISNPVTFQSDSTYKCVLNRSSRIASKLTASGVTINNNAQFAFKDIGTGTLTVGTVFRVIDNTSNLPISGRFRNLSNGLVLTSPDGTKFKVNYTGGTGNDLTLKVVP
jgi:autotransporter-associated beta strand protein